MSSRGRRSTFVFARISIFAVVTATVGLEEPAKADGPASLQDFWADGHFVDHRGEDELRTAAGGTTLVDQPPNQINGLFSDSDCDFCGGGAQTISENFVLGSAAAIGQLVFHGGYFPASIVTPDSFDVLIHQNAGGLPGANVFTATGLSPSNRFDTGVNLFGVDEYEYTIDLNTPSLPAGTYFIEIFNDTSGSPESWFWETGNLDGVAGIAGFAFDFQTPGVFWNAGGGLDMAMVLSSGTTAPDVSAVKTLIEEPTAEGDTVVYEIELTNDGGAQADDPTVDEVVDVLPPELTPTDVTATSGTAAISGNTVTWNGAIADGETVVITITATLDAGAMGFDVDNVATISTDTTGDGNADSEFDTNTVTFCAAGGAGPDCGLTTPTFIKEAFRQPFFPGSIVGYHLTIINDSPAPMNDYLFSHEVIDNLPDGLLVISAAATAGSANADVTVNQVRWDGTVPAGGTVVISVRALVLDSAAASSLHNQAQLFFDQSGDGVLDTGIDSDDPDTPAFPDATSIAVGGTPPEDEENGTPPDGDDLDAQLAASGSFVLGEAVTYTATLVNDGANTLADGSGDEFVLALPAGVAFVSGEATSGTTSVDDSAAARYAAGGEGAQVVRWNGSVLAGGAVVVTVQARLSSGTPGPVSSQGSLLFDADGDGSNETSLPTDDPDTVEADDATTFDLALPPLPFCLDDEAGDCIAGCSMGEDGAIEGTCSLGSEAASAPGAESPEEGVTAPTDGSSSTASGGGSSSGCAAGSSTGATPLGLLLAAWVLVRRRRAA